jgi:hypothetical protein
MVRVVGEEGGTLELSVENLGVGNGFDDEIVLAEVDGEFERKVLTLGSQGWLFVERSETLMVQFEY